MGYALAGDDEGPQSGRFWMNTWTGRIIVVNTVLFVLLAFKSGSLMVPDMGTLLAMGAKDPVGLAQGEWWRFLTPVFLHIGIFHFGINTYMLYQVGPQLESMLGGFWFILIYLCSGTFGNIASACFTPNLGAGASGALFGLLGAGYYIERLVGIRLRETGRRLARRAYAMTVLINLGIGLVVPFIDNTAHFGGLVMGVALSAAMLLLRQNQLVVARPQRGWVLLAFLCVLSLGGAWRATNETLVMSSILQAAAEGDAKGRFYYLHQASRLDPDDPGFLRAVERLAEDLAAQGDSDGAAEVQRFFLREHAL